MRERAEIYLTRFLCKLTKKRRAEAEAAFNDVSDSAQFCYALLSLCYFV